MAVRQPQKNFWGLVQQKGPWASDPVDVANALLSRDPGYTRNSTTTFASDRTSFMPAPPTNLVPLAFRNIVTNPPKRKRKYVGGDATQLRPPPLPPVYAPPAFYSKPAAAAEPVLESKAPKSVDEFYSPTSGSPVFNTPNLIEQTIDTAIETKEMPGYFPKTEPVSSPRPGVIPAPKAVSPTPGVAPTPKKKEMVQVGLNLTTPPLKIDTKKPRAANKGKDTSTQQDSAGSSGSNYSDKGKKGKGKGKG